MSFPRTTAPTLTISVCRDQDVALVSLGGRLDAETVEVARAEIEALLENGVRELLFDLAETVFLDDDAAGSLDGLVGLSAAQEAAGLADAPWPPHYRKQTGEAPRVAPSRRKGDGPHFSGRRRSTQPLVTVAKARLKEDALAGLERWKARHPEAAALLHEDDVLVDSMRGRSSTWTRIRVNLRRVPEPQRPAEEAPDPDYDPWRGVDFDPGSPRAPKTRSSS